MKRSSLFAYSPPSLGSKFGILALVLLFLSLSCTACGQEAISDNDSLCTEDVQQEEIEMNDFWVNPDTSPEFPGGEAALDKFIKENLNLFPAGVESDIIGRVILSFTIEEDGTISDIKCMRSPHDDLTEEAIRVVKLMPKWLPGKQNGKAVRVKYVLPFTFRLTSQTTDRKRTPSDRPRSRNRFRQLATLYIASL